MSQGPLFHITPLMGSWPTAHKQDPSLDEEPDMHTCCPCLWGDPLTLAALSGKHCQLLAGGWGPGGDVTVEEGWSERTAEGGHTCAQL